MPPQGGNTRGIWLQEGTILGAAGWLVTPNGAPRFVWLLLLLGIFSSRLNEGSFIWFWIGCQGIAYVLHCWFIRPLSKALPQLHSLCQRESSQGTLSLMTTAAGLTTLDQTRSFRRPTASSDPYTCDLEILHSTTVVVEDL